MTWERRGTYNKKHLRNINGTLGGYMGDRGVLQKGLVCLVLSPKKSLLRCFPKSKAKIDRLVDR